MTTLTKRTTIYLEPEMHYALKIKSVETSHSISELINTLLKEAFLEDADDLQAFRERADEPTMTFESLLEDLRADGKI